MICSSSNCSQVYLFLITINLDFFFQPLDGTYLCHMGLKTYYGISIFHWMHEIMSSFATEQGLVFERQHFL